MNQPIELAGILLTARDLRDSHDVQIHFNPLMIRIIELDEEHEPIELRDSDAVEFYSDFNDLVADHGDALEHVDALLFLAKPHVDQAPQKTGSQSLRGGNDREPGIPLTNVEFVTDMMQFSRFGPLAQMFVLDALTKQATTVANLTKEQLAPMKDSIVAPEAWQGVAIEIRDKLNTRYGD